MGLKKNSPLFFVIVTTSILLFSCGSDKKGKPVSPVNKEIELHAVCEYGIPSDSFSITKKYVRRDQTLGDILLSQSVNPAIIGKLSNIPGDIFDLKHFKAGNRYALFTTSDSSSRLMYMVYEDSQVDYIVFDLTDSLVVRREHKKITVKSRLSEATISNSLWETMQQLNLNPNLALDLSDIFAWTVDFFGLYPGDRFKVFYDEHFVDSLSIGIGTIYAAMFEHRGEVFYAFRYAQDSVPNYWDEKGNSLKKSFLKAPLRFSRISSRYSGRRLHPVLKIYRPHTGVDYVAPEGTPVVSIGDGTVIEKGYTYAAGNYVKIRHNSVYTTGYNHFSHFGKGIEKGIKIKQGQVIGYVGKTGYSTGPHLDMRFWMNGKSIDPLKVKAPPVEPIKTENLDTYLFYIKGFQTKLDSIAPTPVFPEGAIIGIIK